MKVRHAAAFALMGWYLMVPPNQIDFPNAPVSEWEHHASYDTAKECESARSDLARDAGKTELIWRAIAKASSSSKASTSRESRS